jgi:hypothetical protein
VDVAEFMAVDKRFGRPQRARIGEVESMAAGGSHAALLGSDTGHIQAAFDEFIHGFCRRQLVVLDMRKGGWHSRPSAGSRMRQDGYLGELRDSAHLNRIQATILQFMTGPASA